VFSKHHNFNIPNPLFSEEIYIVSISLSSEHAMAIDMYGKLYSWGKGEFGCLGH